MDNNEKQNEVAAAENTKPAAPKKPKVAMPSLQLSSALGGGLGATQMTSREEQEMYKIRGMQDGKVEELINHEKREDERRGENQRKMLQKKVSKGTGEVAGTTAERGKEKKGEADAEQLVEETLSDNDLVDTAEQIKQTQQDKKKKRKKRKKNKANAQAAEQEAPKEPEDVEHNQANPKDGGRFKHNIMASRDLYADSNDDSEDEGIKEYQVGGYHPVHLGEVLIDRYVIVQKLGWGQFSTVWLAKDMKYENTFVALKVQKSAPSYKVAAYDEVEILDVIAKNIQNPEWLKSLHHYHRGNEENIGQVNGEFTSQHTQVVQLLNSFMHYGANGGHFIMVFEILGVNLLEIMKRYDYRGIPMPLVRRMAKQVLIGLDYLHRVCKIIHTDLKPENAIVALGEEELGQIVKDGMITKKSKKDEPRRKLLMDDNCLFIPGTRRPGQGAQAQTLLDGINTDGLTKQQKKKLKKKIKKEREKDDGASNDGGELNIASGSMTVRENTKKNMADDPEGEGPSMNKRTQATLDQIVQMNENEQDLQWQRPRSHSLPNMVFKERDERFDDSDFEEMRQDGHMMGQTSKKSQYVFKLERDFGYEIQEYLSLRREIRRRKQKLLSGELEPDELEKKDQFNGQDEKTVELMKKQGVNVKGPLIDETINCKICDLGNGCWTHFHFVPKIQTRQYRAPEVIMGIDYDASTDLWSFACMIFELITGDFLFNPRPGQDHKKNDDHLALFMELLGPMPKKFAKQGSMFDHYFMQNPKNGKYYFRRIHDLRCLNLERILIYRYFFKPKEAQVFADFLMKILKWCPADRPTAQEMLEHPWLTMPDDYNFRMSEMEYKLFELKDQTVQVANTNADLTAILGDKADLQNPNSTHQARLEFDQIEVLIASKQEQSGHNLYRYPGQLVDSDGEINGADHEDNLKMPYLSDSDEDEKEFTTKLDGDQSNPFIKLGLQTGKDGSEVDSWNKKSKNHPDDLGSEASFNSTKLINGYEDFMVGMQKMMAKTAMQEDDEDKPKEPAEGGVSHRSRQEKKRSKKKRSKSQKQGSESRASRRATSVSSQSSAPLSAIYDKELQRLAVDAENQKEDAAEFDLNISFSGGYVPNTDLGRVDKGQGNPQFQGLDAN